jgi:hypothetical protein
MSHSVESSRRAMKFAANLSKSAIAAGAAALLALVAILAIVVKPQRASEQASTEEAARSASRAMTFTQRPEVAK